MNLEMRDELELIDGSYKKEEEISEIIKLFQFSNLSLLVSNQKGEVIFGSAAFCKMTGFYLKELVRENLGTILGKPFNEKELFQISRETECYSVRRTLLTKLGNKIEVNTYNSPLYEFLNTYIVTIIIPAPVM